MHELHQGYQYKAFFSLATKKKTLIGCLDEKGLGFAYSFAADGERAKKGSQFLKLVLTRKGASYTPGGDTGKKSQRHGDERSGCGTRPQSPLRST